MPKIDGVHKNYLFNNFLEVQVQNLCSERGTASYFYKGLIKHQRLQNSPSTTQDSPALFR